jgi:hypothetical protein
MKYHYMCFMQDLVVLITVEFKPEHMFPCFTHLFTVSLQIIMGANMNFSIYLKLNTALI